MSKKEYQKMWRLKNKEYQKKYYIKNKDKIKEIYKKWRLKNKDKVKRYEKTKLWRNCLTTLNDGGYLIKKFSVKEIKDISYKMVDKEMN